MGFQGGGGATAMISGCLEGKKLSLCQCSVVGAARCLAHRFLSNAAANAADVRHLVGFRRCYENKVCSRRMGRLQKSPM